MADVESWNRGWLGHETLPDFVLSATRRRRGFKLSKSQSDTVCDFASRTPKTSAIGNCGICGLLSEIASRPTSQMADQWSLTIWHRKAVGAMAALVSSCAVRSCHFAVRTTLRSTVVKFDFLLASTKSVLRRIVEKNCPPESGRRTVNASRAWIFVKVHPVTSRWIFFHASSVARISRRS